MNFLHAILLGIVQGITEWLPISSSGHLVIFQHFFNITQPVIFDLFLHLGSLIVILIVFRKDIQLLIKGILRRNPNYIRFLIYLVIASIPIALVGYFLNDLIKSIFVDIKTVAFSLLITAFFLFMSKYPIKKTNNLNFLNSFIIGISQAIAILPGASRSGLTISTGLIQGVKKRETVRFAFLMFIPAIIGATLFELRNISQITNIPILLIGTLAAIISGILSLKLLLFVIKKNKLRYFSYYCLALAVFLLIIAYI